MFKYMKLHESKSATVKLLLVQSNSKMMWELMKEYDLSQTIKILNLT